MTTSQIFGTVILVVIFAVILIVGFSKVKSKKDATTKGPVTVEEPKPNSKSTSHTREQV